MLKNQMALETVGFIGTPYEARCRKLLNHSSYPDANVGPAAKTMSPTPPNADTTLAIRS